MHEPKLLILDEPTSGLDPLIQKRFYEVILEENRKGTTVFWSSHVLSEVQKMCNRVAILKEGRVLRVEEVETLRSRQLLKVQVSFAGPASRLPEGLEGIVNPVRENDTLKFYVSFPMERLPRLLAQIAAETASARRVIDLLDTPIERKDGADFSPDPRYPAVEFRNVTFTYPGSSQPALSGVSFKVDLGETVAVVGSSGSGKSTLFRLLLGDYEPDEGEVLVFGRDLREWSLTALRSHFSYVGQTTYLFPFSVRENLRLGDEALDDDRLQAAARLAQADGFVRSLPQGYDTPVGELGNRISGGGETSFWISQCYWSLWSTQSRRKTRSPWTPPQAHNAQEGPRVPQAAFRWLRSRHIRDRVRQFLHQRLPCSNAHGPHQGHNGVLTAAPGADNSAHGRRHPVHGPLGVLVRPFARVQHPQDGERHPPCTV